MVSARLSFGDLIHEFESRLGVEDVLTPETIDHDKLIELMKLYQSDEPDWSKYALHDLSRNYSRNGVENFGQNANLLVIVWEPGKGSMVHDHAAAHCVMKVLKGKLKEYLYTPGNTTELKRESELGADEVTYIADHLGYHKIVNESDELAVTLHLYTPPYAKINGFHIIDVKNGKKFKIHTTNLYSWKGEVLNETDAQ